MVLTNHLSCFPSHSNNLPTPIAYYVQHIQLSKAELDIIQDSVECDLVYCTIYHLTHRGWPKCWQDICPHCPTLLGHKGQWCPLNLACSSRGQEVCILPELLDCMLADLHGTHQGINGVQAAHKGGCVLARHRCQYHVNYVCQCTICIKHKASNPAQPTLPRDATWWPLAGNCSGLSNPPG